MVAAAGLGRHTVSHTVGRLLAPWPHPTVSARLGEQSTRPIAEHAMSELALRTSNGLDVALLWNRCTDRLVVAVADDRTGESFTVDAPRDRALDVYNHPFAYTTSHA